MQNPDTTAETDTDQPVWRPEQSRINKSRLKAFMQNEAEHRAQSCFYSYDELWQWSVADPHAFWDAVWDFCGIIGDKGEHVLINPEAMPGARFFPDAQINYAENLLRRRDAATAIIYTDERGRTRQLSFADLYSAVRNWQQALINAGIENGDRVAGYLPNIPETVIAMLATTSLGAIWSSASPDFGAQAILDRFGQIAPKVLIAVDGYYYNGKSIDCRDKLAEIQQQLDDLQQTIVIPFAEDNPDISALHATVLSDEILSAATNDIQHDTIHFERVAFNHPLFILYSSGTTGAPKCITHCHGGTLIQHLKEHQLHADIGAQDRVFYFTTCGWMMWNWLVTALASEACIALYDGNPFYPDGTVLWDFAERQQLTFFGTAAKYIDALKANGIHPAETRDLRYLRTLASTGSPLVHEAFDFIYSKIKGDLHVASISGGTDIVSCFVLGNPVSPVYRGEIQCAGLGMAVDVYDDNACSLPPGGGPGELVCLRPFPSMPVGLWGDADGKKFHEAYFSTFDGVWAHGDWIEKTTHGGFIIHGRSDAVLNPGGIRIGTAEIYRQVEKLEEVLESVAVGQQIGNDERVILFVRLAEDSVLDDRLTQRIKTRLKTEASPRHVPAKILQVNDIPRTRNGKISEKAVRKVIHGHEPGNAHALANPQALEAYKNRPELQEE